MTTPLNKRTERFGEKLKSLTVWANTVAHRCMKTYGYIAKGAPISEEPHTLSDIMAVIDDIPDLTDHNAISFIDSILKVDAVLAETTFVGQPVVVIDDLKLGFGALIVHGFNSLDEAVAWGKKFQKNEGDYPCWNAITLRSSKAPVTMNILRDDLKNPSRKGEWIRRIYRETRNGVGTDVASVNFIGPFRNTDVMQGFAMRDETARQSAEWQAVELDLKWGPRWISEEAFTQALAGRYLTDPGGEMDTASVRMALLRGSDNALEIFGQNQD